MQNNRLKIILSGFAFTAAILYAVVGVSGGSSKMFMNGEISFKHALLANDCDKCHEPWQGPADQKCTQCHEGGKHFPPHKASVIEVDKEKKLTCGYCHNEHDGIRNNIMQVDSKKCRECHTEVAHNVEGAQETPIIEKTESGSMFPHQFHFEQEVFEKDGCPDCHTVESDGGGVMFAQGFVMDMCAGCHELEEHDTLAMPDEACGPCHGEETIKGLSDEIAPTDGFVYSHQKHESLKCLTCHQMLENEYLVNEQNATVAQCISCHAPKAGISDCIVCHSYHTPE